MKNILFLFVFACFSLFFAQRSDAQCYVRLEDASGFNTDAYQDTLQAAAAKLCAIFDSTGFDGQFKVYDFGFYLHQENTTGGYPEPFLQKMTEVQDSSPYYLLFGKQTDKSGVYTRFWVNIKLPNLGDFYCLSRDNPTFNFDLSYKYQFFTNAFHKGNGYAPDLYADAEQKAMEDLATLIGKVLRCCSQNVNICEVCLLTPAEIRNYLNAQGYAVTPIKILSGNPARKDSVKNKSNLPGISDLCTDITSIEIDGTICNDFPAVISHFMGAYPGGTGEAKISDDDCLCNRGGLEYFNAGPPYPGTQHIRMKIHISRGIPGITGQEEDVIYSQIFAPYELGTLPFNAYLPNRISESSSLSPPVHLSSLNMGYVKGTVESIFSKNGMNLSNISLQKPVPPYKEYDIYNGLIWNTINIRPSVGRSAVDFSLIPSPSNFELGGNFVEFNFFDSYFNIFSNSTHLNYSIGYHFAHELVHQMIAMSLGYFKEYGLLKNGIFTEPNLESFYSEFRSAGHVNDQLNLLLEGEYFKEAYINPCGFITEEQKSKLRSLSGWQGQVKYLCPNKTTNDYQQMEQISPGAKALFTYFKIMRSLRETYPDKTSCEIVCGSKILVNTIKMMKLEEYDGF